ncbi:capsule assembly Wzi family protein [Algoriphagus jejuensis]
MRKNGKFLSVSIFCFLVLGFNSSIFSQTIPVGTPVLDEYLRRLQLTGQVDSASSWMIRPIYPTEAFGVENGFDLDSSVVDLDMSDHHGRFGKDAKGKFLIMPGVYKMQYNSTYASGANEGAFIPNRGIQQIFSPGVYAEYKNFTLQFQPEILLAQNKDYLGFPIEHQATILFYYEYMNRIDMPERFGDKAYNRVYAGQSSFRFNLKEYSVGISTESLWWGPGRKNSLLLGNNAPGFLHFTLNTRKPVKTGIGSFEGQAIAGFLKSTEYLPPWPDYTIQQNPVYIPKRENGNRYVSGLIFTYQPKWIPGLFLGYGSVNHMYRSDVSSFADLLPVFNGRKKPSNVEDPITEKRQQFSSGYFRWLSPQGRFEFYGEYGTRGNSRKFEEFVTTPETGRAFTFGFAHLIDLKKPGRFLEVSSEMTLSGQTIREEIRQLRTWYIHDHVRHGYTHQGQTLGIGNGPAANQLFVGVAWVEGMKKIGLQFERIEYNSDFYYYRYEASKDIRNKYLDLIFGLTPEWKFGDFLLSAKFQYVSTLNYKWYLENDPDIYFVPGYDRENFVGQLGLTYMFR